MNIFLGNILISFEPSFVTDLMKAGFLLSIILSFPLCVLPCRTSFHSLVYGRVCVAALLFFLKIAIIVLYFLLRNPFTSKWILVCREEPPDHFRISDLKF